MALLKLGPMVGGISGSIAATTFARNRAGYYARQRTKPKIPVSLRRDFAQQLVGNYVKQWQNTLLPAERAAWTHRGQATIFTNKVGDAYVPTGLNLFLRSNAQLINSGQAEITAPPVQAIAPTYAPTLLHVGAAGIEVGNANQFDGTLTGNILIFRAHNLPQSKNFYKGPWDDMVNQTIADMVIGATVISGSSKLVANTRTFYAFVPVLADGGVGAKIYTYCDVGSPV